ncbi:ABC-three component system middle component 7, partial [Vibrio cholerae]
MIVPNKSIRFKDSIMFKMLCILDLEFDEIEVSDLYKKIKKHFDCID